MCILCVIQKWSRSIAAMLPWLVIPLIVLWALSQLLPPAFQFEITSPRIACVLVLLVTLFWYEVLMPNLSRWCNKRNARLKEKKRSEAIEMQKLRKTATRRCRNCLTAYRDQNPGGGKFMCSYCGHISKRPVLDLPVPPGMGNSGILKDLVGKGNKWMCRQDCLENGSWSNGPFAGNSSYWKKGGSGGLYGGDDDHCLAEKSYSRVFIFARKALRVVFLCVVWLWRKIFRLNSSRGDASADVDGRGGLDNRGENGVSGQESRGEKARRKAEEKRQARLEKELLEEEERKQREEVSRLVEERRRLRDEITEAEKVSGKGSPRGKAKDSKRESEKKRQERKKERDKGSSKSNSDVEEMEKRAGKGDRGEQHVSATDSMKTHVTEIGHGFKGASASIHNRGNAGTRYLDRMRGSFLSSSRAFTGGSFFGKGTNSSSVSREHKPSGLVGNVQSSMYRKELVQPDRVSVRSTVGDDKSVNRPVFIEPQPCTTPKKSWQQLFTLSSSNSPPPSTPSVISRTTGTIKAEAQNSPISDYPTPVQSFDNPINFGLPNQLGLPSFPFGPNSGSNIPPKSPDVMLPKTLDSPHQLLPEELEVFEDPCYVPDPISLLGPVSESIDNFQLDRGFAMNTASDKPCPVKAKSTPVATKPSPIESPLSRSRVSDERHVGSHLTGTLEDQDNSSNTNNNGTWQMWTSSPLGQDGFGIVGGPVISWHLYPEMKVQRKEDHIHPVPRKTMASLFKKDEQAHSGDYPPQNGLFGHSQNGGAFNMSQPSNVDDPWLPKTLFESNLYPENQVLLKPGEEHVQSGLIYGNSSSSAVNHQFELPAAHSWHREDWSVQGPRDGFGNPQVGGAHNGGVYTPSDVESLW